MTKLLPVPRRLRFWAIREGKRIAWSLLLLVCLVICIVSFGVVENYFERDFETSFSYPLDIPNFPEVVRSFGRGEKVEYQPINENYSRIKFHDELSIKCLEGGPIGLLILVKSAPHYFEKRAVIRATWGDPEYLQNISRSISHSHPLLSCLQEEKSKGFQSTKPVFQIKLFFLLGRNLAANAKNLPVSEKMTTNSPVLPEPVVADELDNSIESQLETNNDNNKKDKSSQKLTGLLQHSNAKGRLKNDNGFDKVQWFEGSHIKDEILKFNDIVRADFLDSYDMNTFKTMMGIRFAIEKCSNFLYSFLVDDDMHINLKNLIRYLESPREYPFVRRSTNLNTNDRGVSEPQCNPLNKDLYAGKVLTTRPIRYKVGQVSKWYLSLQEYAFNYFPPYMPAAAIIMSKSVVQDFYWASFYTGHFRFDDVYLGLLAYKMNISPISSNYFYVCHSQDGRCEDDTGHEDSSFTNLPNADRMKYIIAKHGLVSPVELLSFWQDQKASGNVDFE